MDFSKLSRRKRRERGPAFCFEAVSVKLVRANLVITSQLMTMQRAISAACETQTTDKLTGCFPRCVFFLDDAPDC
jgi:hypothetical protein